MFFTKYPRFLVSMMNLDDNVRRGAQLQSRSVILDKISAYDVVESSTLGGSSGAIYWGDRFNEYSRVHNSEFLLCDSSDD